MRRLDVMLRALAFLPPGEIAAGFNECVWTITQQMNLPIFNELIELKAN
jgi:hypothetical protein